MAGWFAVRALGVANQKCEPTREPAASTHPNAFPPCVPICVLAVRNLRSNCAVQRKLLRLEHLRAARASRGPVREYAA